MKTLDLKSLVVGAIGMTIVFTTIAANTADEKAIEYSVVGDATPIRLQGRVQQFMSEGWRVQGGIAYHEPTKKYIQAMVR